MRRRICIAVKKLLAEHILHLMDDPRYLRGRYPFPPGHHNNEINTCAGYALMNELGNISIRALLIFIDVYETQKYLRGRYPFPPGHHREILRLIDVYKNQQSANTDVPTPVVQAEEITA
jgi:hypothetical protein